MVLQITIILDSVVVILMIMYTQGKAGKHQIPGENILFEGKGNIRDEI